MSGPGPGPEEPPLVRVVRGDLDDDEAAALVAVLAAGARGGAPGTGPDAAPGAAQRPRAWWRPAGYSAPGSWSAAPASVAPSGAPAGAAPGGPR